MSETEARLARAIEQAYRAFADVRAPMAFDAPPHRNPKALVKQLTSASLPTLTDEQLGPYAGWAMTTVGDARDYQYFLPRILEITRDGGGHMGYDPPIIAGKVVYGHWEGWRTDRRQAVLEVFEAAFAASLPREHQATTPDEWLCGLARLTDVTAHLDLWRQAVEPWPAIHLASFRRSWIDGLANDGQPPPFWDEVDIGTATLVEAWLLSTESRRQIERALSLAPEEERWQLQQALSDQ